MGEDLMRLALSGTELDDGEPIDDMIASALELSVGHIELWHPRNTSHYGVNGTFTRLNGAGLRVACVSTGSELYRNGGSATDQALLMEAIALAGRFGAPLVNTYFGYAPDQDDDRAIYSYIEYLRPCIDVAASRGVTIVLENEFNAFGVDDAASDITRRPASLRRLASEANSSYFRINFDPSNSYCAGVRPFPEAYEMLAPFIGYVHVKDCRQLEVGRVEPAALQDWKRYRDFNTEYVTCPLGDGAVPWKDLLARLRSDDYRGFLALEPHAQPNRLQWAWAQAAAFVRQCWPSAGPSLLS
jgi:sugar phosphate isomerase/epimerase